MYLFIAVSTLLGFVIILSFGFYGSATLATSCLIVAFFTSLFFIGNPYMSLVLVGSCFVAYCWVFLYPIFKDKYFLALNGVLLLVLTQLRLLTDFMLFEIFVFKFLLCVIGVCVLIYVYKQEMFCYVKTSFLVLGFYVFILGFLCVQRKSFFWML